MPSLCVLFVFFLWHIPNFTHASVATIYLHPRCDKTAGDAAVASLKDLLMTSPVPVILSVTNLRERLGCDTEGLAFRSVKKWLKERIPRNDEDGIVVNDVRDTIRIHNVSHTEKKHIARIPVDLQRIVQRVVITPATIPKDKKTVSKRRAWKPRVVSHTEEGTPDNVRQSMGVPDGLYGDARIHQLVWGPGTYGVLLSDVALYYSTFNVTTENATSNIDLEGYASKQHGGDNFGEASLDTDVISGIAPHALTIVYNSNVSGATEEGPGFGWAFASFVSLLLEKSDDMLPHVMSLSLGSQSFYSCDLMCQNAESLSKGKYNYTTCLKYLEYTQRQVCMYSDNTVVERIDYEMMKLTARGTTIAAAAGDGGMHFGFKPFTEPWLNQVACNYSMPTYPAASPFVLAVGGTQWGPSPVYNGSVTPTTPIQWQGGGSSFSGQFPIPPWQNVAVEGYLRAASGLPGFPQPGAFVPTSRAYPDLSALASGVPMVYLGNIIVAGGTSASAPIIGGLLSLLSAERLKMGKGRLGYLNALLYNAAYSHQSEMFYDVVNGNSKCTSSECSTCKTGFPAAPGWDAASGWGAPRWEGFVKYLVQELP